MKGVSLIGLGAMGTALTGVLVKASHEVTVWNRSQDRMKPIVALGAKGASSLAEVVQASPVLMVCVTDYDATRSLLRQADIVPLLDGRTVVQLSTGTPAEASEAERWFQRHGAIYLDGAIMVYPATVGTRDAQLLIAGPEAAYQDVRPMLRALADDLRYLGSNVRLAAALDLALLSRLLGIVFGAIHGLHICEVEGVSPQQFADLLPEGERSRSLAQTVARDDYSIGGDAATVEVAAALVARLQSQATAAGSNSDFPDFMASLTKRAIAAGFGRQDTAAVVKVLRDGG